MATLTATAAAGVRKPWYSVHYVQVLIAVALGIVIGHFAPDTGANM
jgi:aerobic C4-dicarboxylate transport protein